MSEPSTGSARPFGLTDVSLLLVATIWAINFSAVKYASHAFGAVAFTGLRVGSAAILLVALSRLLRLPLPSRRDALLLIGLGVVGNGMQQLCFITGVSQTKVGNAALVVAATPAFVAVVSRLRGLERIARRMIVGIVLSFVGVGVVILGSAASPAGTTTVTGTLLVLLGSICWALFTVGLGSLTRRVDALQISAFAMLGGVVPLVAITPRAIAHVPWSTLPAMAWWSLLYSAAVAMAVAYYFWYRGIRVLGPTRTAIYGNLQPVVAIAAGWLLLREAPTVWQGIGAGTIISGVFLTRA